jgi:hypothetical protein
VGQDVIMDPLPDRWLGLLLASFSDAGPRRSPLSSSSGRRPKRFTIAFVSDTSIPSFQNGRSLALQLTVVGRSSSVRNVSADKGLFAMTAAMTRSAMT